MLFYEEETGKPPRKEGKGHRTPFGEGRLGLPSKEVFCVEPRCCWGGPGGAVGDERLSGGPLTPAVPREMSQEAAGWQTSRCALKKPWRLAGAYPNLCRRQISPGSSGDPSAPLASNSQMQNGRQLGLLWTQAPARKSGHHHTHQGPQEGRGFEEYD